MVPPGIPGRSDADFLPEVRPGRRAGDCWPRPATRAAPASRHDPDDRRLRLRRGHRRPRSSASSGSRSGRDDGRRLLRSPGDGPAGDVVARPGSPTTPAATTSSACCSAADATNNYGHWSSPAFDAAIAEAGVGDRSGGGRGAPTTGPRRSSATRSRSSRSSTGRAGRCREPGCSAPARTASASSAWRGWRGRTDAPLAAPAAARSLVVGRAAARASSPAVGRAPTPVTFGTPTADSTFGKGIVFSQPVTRRRADRTRRAPADRRRRDRTDRRRDRARPPIDRVDDA